MPEPLILLVEDDVGIAEIQELYLRNANFSVLTVTDGQDVLPATATHKPALILLDRMLPNRDGLTLCQQLRTITTVPIIMITALREDQDRLDGFAAGVDDYLCKPFNPSEMVARVQAVLRRVPPFPSVLSPPALLHFDPKAQCAYAAGKPLDLTGSEYRILACLHHHRGTIISRETLIQHCFQRTEIYDRAVDNHILNLRKKLAAAIPHLDLIHSSYAQGYLFEERPRR